MIKAKQADGTVKTGSFNRDDVTMGDTALKGYQGGGLAGITSTGGRSMSTSRGGAGNPAALGQTTMATAFRWSSPAISPPSPSRSADLQELSASGQVKASAGLITGIFVASASGTPTVKVWDNTSAATTVLVNTFTPAGATFFPCRRGSQRAATSPSEEPSI